MARGLKPFVKRPGGKGYRLPFVRDLLADFPCAKYRYCEPMVGGGAIFLDVGGRFKSRVISDADPDLVNLYEVVRDDVEGLISEMGNGSYFFVRKSDPSTLENYLRIRASDPITPVARAARLLYLNKTCFNGLTRTNLRGRFNTAPGSYVDPVVCDAGGLRAASRALAGVAVGRVDATKWIRNLPDRPTLLVVDPPYDADVAGKFSGYFGRFERGHQERLVRAMLGSGHRYIYFNRSTEFVRPLFEGSGATLAELPLRHSIQPKYTEGMVETELIAHNLPARGAGSVGAGGVVGVNAWRGY